MARNCLEFGRCLHIFHWNWTKKSEGQAVVLIQSNIKNRRKNIGLKNEYVEEDPDLANFFVQFQTITTKQRGGRHVGSTHNHIRQYKWSCRWWGKSKLPPSGQNWYKWVWTSHYSIPEEESNGKNSQESDNNETGENEINDICQLYESLLQ